MLPLDESHVEEFLDLAVQLADLDTHDAAVVLFGVLDDNCDLGGVMQTVSERLQELLPKPLISAMLATLPDTTTSAPHALRSVLRGVVLSNDCRRYLKERWAELSPAQRATLGAHIAAIGQFETYRRACADVIDE